MDPNKNLAEQVELAGRFIRQLDLGVAIPNHEVDRLADLVTDLDAWIRKGGALPTAWSPPQGAQP